MPSARQIPNEEPAACFRAVSDLIFFSASAINADTDVDLAASLRPQLRSRVHQAAASVTLIERMGRSVPR